MGYCIQSREYRVGNQLLALAEHEFHLFSHLEIDQKFPHHTLCNLIAGHRRHRISADAPIIGNRDIRRARADIHQRDIERAPCGITALIAAIGSSVMLTIVSSVCCMAP